MHNHGVWQRRNDDGPCAFVAQVSAAKAAIKEELVAAGQALLYSEPEKTARLGLPYLHPLISQTLSSARQCLFF